MRRYRIFFLHDRCFGNNQKKMINDGHSKNGFGLKKGLKQKPLHENQHRTYPEACTWWFWILRPKPFLLKKLCLFLNLPGICNICYQKLRALRALLSSTCGGLGALWAPCWGLKCVEKNFKKFQKILPISDLKVIGTKLIILAHGDW